MTGTATRTLSAKPTLVAAGPRARMAWTARPCPRTAWWRTWFSSESESRRPGADPTWIVLPPPNLHVGSLVAPFHEGGELVDREQVLDPVAELLGHESLLCQAAGS
jgi:hypothetical protein